MNPNYFKLSAIIALVAGMLSFGAAQAGFERGIVLNVDGVDYYLAGAPDGPGGSVDIPGHSWVKAGKDKVVGMHFNTGPFGAPRWWSSDAPDGGLLYMVHGTIDTWSVKKAEHYAARNYTHYHELVSVEDGTLHPHKVVWLKHTAVDFFNFDGGPAPWFAHVVSPGPDELFIPNYRVPYDGGGH